MACKEALKCSKSGIVIDDQSYEDGMSQKNWPFLEIVKYINGLPQIVGFTNNRKKGIFLHILPIEYGFGQPVADLNIKKGFISWKS